MNDGERRRALKRFADEGGRTQPPVFVGRNAVIKNIATAAKIAYDKWRSGDSDAKDPGLTRLVQGAPGVGKTSLLRHLQGRWEGDPSPERPIAVRVSAGALDSPAEMHQHLLDQIPITAAGKWGEILVRSLVKLVPGGGEAIAPAAEEATKTLRDKVSAPIPGPVVVMVDEAQRVQPNSPAARTLQNLHDGAFGAIPVLAVFAGLAHLHSHLQQKGINISRYSHDSRCVHTLGALSEQDSKLFFRQWLRHFGVAATSAEFDQWSDALIRDAQGWPMHINGFLGSLAEDIERSLGPISLASAEIEAVRRAAAKDRRVYYNGRYSGVVESNTFWAGRAMAALSVAGPVLKEEAISIIGSTTPSDDENASSLFSALVERGFLQRQGTEMEYISPIPSLTSHAAILALKERKAHTAASVGDVDALRRHVADGGGIEDRDALGRTPLTIGAECRWADVVEFLVGAGAKLDARDLEGKSAREAWPEFDWSKKAPVKKNENGGGSGTSGGPGGMT